MTSAELCQAAWAGRPTDRLSVQPICMSFAARDAGVPFRRYAEDTLVLARCQARVAEVYGFDIVSLTSDPCREAHDLGQAILWFDDDPPMPDPGRPLVREYGDLSSLTLPDPSVGRMGAAIAGIRALREMQDRPVLGWVEGPIAEAADIRGLSQIIEDLLDEPDWVDELFSFLVTLALRYAEAQVRAGAAMIGIGDAAASLIGPDLYRQHIFPAELRLVKGIQALGVPVRLHVCGNTTHLLEDFARLGVEMVDIDSVADLTLAKRAFGDSAAILGNLDPVRDFRDGTPKGIRRGLAECHAIVGQRHILGAGCEFPADTPPENVRALHEYALLSAS